MSLYDLPAKVFSCIRYSKLLICTKSNISKGSKCRNHKFHQIIRCGWPLLVGRSTDSKRLLRNVQVFPNQRSDKPLRSYVLSSDRRITPQYKLLIKQVALKNLESPDGIPLYWPIVQSFATFSVYILDPECKANVRRLTDTA